jgi:hypothetical protein
MIPTWITMALLHMIGTASQLTWNRRGNMPVQPVLHVNLIGHEINESLEDYPDSDRKVFCRKNMKVMEPMESDCMNCSYFAGLAQGYGHECVWDDWMDMSDDNPRVIQQSDANKEMQRVFELVENSVIS